ncbi:MAG: hypothetical protein ACXWML_09830 [Candidatus Binataceae bacterium]
MATEEKFPTLRDLRDGLTRLIDAGLGDLPTQVLVVPASTLACVARYLVPELGQNHRPKMIEFEPVEGRLGALIYTTDFDNGRATLPPLGTQ